MADRKYIQVEERKYSEKFKIRRSLVHSCPPCPLRPPKSKVDKNNLLQNLDRDVRTRFCIRQSVMMIRQIVAASGRPSIIGVIFSHTYGNTGASSVSSSGNPWTCWQNHW